MGPSFGFTPGVHILESTRAYFHWSWRIQPFHYETESVFPVFIWHYTFKHLYPQHYTTIFGKCHEREGASVEWHSPRCYLSFIENDLRSCARSRACPNFSCNMHHHRSWNMFVLHTYLERIIATTTFWVLMLTTGISGSVVQSEKGMSETFRNLFCC